MLFAVDAKRQVIILNTVWPFFITVMKTNLDENWVTILSFSSFAV